MRTSNELATLLTLMLIGLTTSLKGEILLNEIYIDPPGTDSDTNLEYIELISTSGGVESTAGFTLLVIDSNNGGYGKIRNRWALDGFETGENGLLLLGSQYSTSSPYNDVPTETRLAAPSRPDVMSNGDLGSNGGFTLLLVKGFSAQIARDTDLDGDDNGTLDITPWTALVDSIGFNDTDPLDPPNRTSYAFANVSQAGYFPENVSRTSGDVTPNAASAWFGGLISSSSGSFEFDQDDRFGGFPGAGATPGRPNSPPPIADLRLNEISINPNGNDENLEFIEIVSVSGGRERADSYHVVVISNDPASSDSGTIVEAWDLAQLSTGDNGLLIIGDSYSKPIAGKRPDTPFKLLVEEQTEAGDPASFGRNDIEPSEGISILLVTGFVGDTGMDLDGGNDGQLDLEPWDAIIDSVGFDNQNQITGAFTRTYAEGRLPSVTFYPDNLSRVAGNLDANSGNVWYGGDYGGDSQGSIAFDEKQFSPENISLIAMRATPGGINLSPNDLTLQRDLLINEVLIDAPPTPENADDRTHEFIEIISTNKRSETLEGLSILIVDTAPESNQIGVIRQVLDLSGLSTGANGLCLIGDSYNDLLLDAPVPFDTNREDPQGLNAGDLSPNDGLTVLLVEGFTGVIREDIDTNDDGVFDTQPWSKVLDAVGFGMITDPAVTVLTQAAFAPDTFARLPDSLKSEQRTEPSAWIVGLLEGQPTNTDYASTYFGTFRGGVTRGYENHAAPLLGSASVFINEVLIHPEDESPSARDESIELIVSSLDARSLSGYSLVLLDSKGGSVGTIDHIWDLSGMATGTNGLLLIGEGYDTSLPFEVDPETAARAPIGMKSGDIGSDSSLSLLLVKGLRPTVNEGTDLDVSLVASFDDDGILDLTPWTAIADGVGYREYDGDLSINVGITYGLTDLTQSFEPDALARRAAFDYLNVGQASDWYGGDFGSSSSSRFGYDSTQTFGVEAGIAATPGFHNEGSGFVNGDLTDTDGDGRTWLEEIATGTDPDTADAPSLTSIDLVSGSDPIQLTFTHLRLTGGTMTDEGVYRAQGILYRIEASEDLDVWQSVSTTASEATTSSLAGIEKAHAKITLPTASEPREIYLRLKIVRSADD